MHVSMFVRVHAVDAFVSLIYISFASGPAQLFNLVLLLCYLYPRLYPQKVGLPSRFGSYRAFWVASVVWAFWFGWAGCCFGDILSDRRLSRLLRLGSGLGFGLTFGFGFGAECIVA